MKTFMTILTAGMMVLAAAGTAQADVTKVFVFDEAGYNGPIGGFYSGSFGGPWGPAAYITGNLNDNSFAGVKLLWVVPADNFSPDEISTMASFLSGGGRIGFLGAWYGMASARDESINAAVAGLGGHILINSTFADNGYPHYEYRTDGKILSDPFTNNVNLFVHGPFSPLSVSGSARSLVLGEDGSSVLLACEDIGAGTIFVMTSQSAWDLDPFSAGTDNRTLFTNILNVTFGSMSIQKCTVAAGKILDSISFSGTLDATEADFTLAMGDVVEVGIESDLMSGISFQFPIKDTTFKKGKFKYSESSKGSTYAFSYDTKKGAMAFSAKNINLAGLACPITVRVTIGNYKARIILDEAVVNGSQYCPMVFIQGFANSLTVNKSVFKPGKAAGQDSFTVSGTFTTAGDPIPGQDFAVSVGTQTFTVDDSAFTQKIPKVYTCTNVPVNGTNALMSAMLDYNKCTYTLTVKNASFSQFGTLPVKMEVFGYTLNGDKPVHFNRKTKNVTEIEICTEYDYGQPDKDDDEFVFSIDITTDSAVSKLEIKWPSGQTYLIPNNDYGSTAPFNGGWREVASEYDDDEDCYDWWYWIVFDTADDLLNNMEDGLYEFTFYFNDLTTQKTTVWFGIPKTSNPIPQPTQMPVFTSFADGATLPSPVTFQWQPCTDPTALNLWLCLYDENRDRETEWEIKKTANGLRSPLRLQPGSYEAELDFDAWYDFINEDGIPVEVGKYSECDYYFEVN